METDKKSWHLETTEKVEEAANNGDAHAQTVLGYRYHFGSEGLPENHAEAVFWYRRAAGKGLEVAEACLAEMYRDGCGVLEDSWSVKYFALEKSKWMAGYQNLAGWRNIASESRSVYASPILKGNKAAHLQMLIWSIVDDDTSGFQKMVKYFDRFKGSFKNEDYELWSGKEKILELFFCRACELGEMEMVKAIFLEAKNLDINDKFFSYSPLVTAAEKNNFELAEFCLHVGADPFKPQTLAGNIKITPLEIARKNGHTKLARLFEQAEKGKVSGRVKSLFWKFERSAHEKGWL